MRALSLLLGSVTLWCGAPLPLPAQQAVEPYQIFSASFGWGAVGPREDTGLSGEAADAGASIQLGLDLEIRQSPWAYLYGRVDADAADVRQHLGFSGGIRFRPFRRGRLRPVAGFGVGLYWLEPKIDTRLALDREFPLRGEAHVGAEWIAVPGMRLFFEYRVAGSRYAAVVREDGCSPADSCLAVSSTPLLHVAHTGWLGIRLKMF